MKTIWRIILAAALLLALVSSCADMDNLLGVSKPTAKIKGIQFTDVSLDAATLLFDVEVHNPYPVSLPLTNLDYQLNSRGSQLLAGQAGVKTSIPAKQSKVVPLQANVKYLDLIKAFKDFRPGMKVPYEAQVELMVDAPGIGALPLPIKKKGEIAVPDIPKASDIDWGQVIRKTVGD